MRLCSEPIEFLPETQISIVHHFADALRRTKNSLQSNAYWSCLPYLQLGLSYAFEDGNCLNQLIFNLHPCSCRLFNRQVQVHAYQFKTRSRDSTETIGGQKHIATGLVVQLFISIQFCIQTNTRNSRLPKEKKKSWSYLAKEGPKSWCESLWAWEVKTKDATVSISLRCLAFRQAIWSAKHANACTQYNTVKWGKCSDGISV